MNKREAVLDLARTKQSGPYTPAAFFLHFPEKFHRGQAAIQKHIDYFRASGNDILKVQYERHYPEQAMPNPDAWRKVPSFDVDFYADQVDVVAGLARELKQETVIIVTLYSAYMFASHFAGWSTLDQHMQQDPNAVSAGLSSIVDSMSGFIRACVDAGADGFYVSSQGGEAGRFEQPSLFDDFIKPHEMAVWDSIRAAGAEFNVLHVCDYELPYDSLSRFAEYPGDVVSAPLTLKGQELTGVEVAKLFARPFMGGLERLESLSEGTPEDVESDAIAALETGPDAMILGADCTLSASASWENVRRATDVAHAHKRA